MALMTTDHIMTCAEIAAAPTREIRKHRDWLDFWCRALKWEYSQEYRIARDACDDELDARSRKVEMELR